MKKKLLIAGAYGLVGSNLCKRLEQFTDIEVTKVKYDEIFPADNDYDYIIHAAGYGQPIKFSKDKLETLYIHGPFTHNLFCCLKSGGTFLYVSSSEIYSGCESATPNENDIGTTTPQHPRACYIEGKRYGEAICMAYKEQGVDVKIARLALAYGPGTKKGDTRAINHFIEQALTTGKIKMKDSGDAIRTYLYIDDCVDMLVNILLDGKNTVYNVGGENTVYIYTLASIIARLTGATVEEGNEPLTGAPNDVAIDIRRIKEEFGQQFTPLEKGLKATITYQRSLYE